VTEEERKLVLYALAGLAAIGSLAGFLLVTHELWLR